MSLAWLCGDGPALYGCANCGRCLEHCKCGTPAPTHILALRAQTRIIQGRREWLQEDVRLPIDPDDPGPEEPEN